MAGLIVGNFVMNIVEKTIDPDPDNRSAESLWSFCEYFFNVVFTIELAINMYSFWFWEFWNSGWNVFDFVVVSIGLMSVLQVPLPGPLKLLRMMRAFRVFRLFKRIKSLRKIIAALGRAVPGVVNAFVILLIVMSIYSMLAVEFFRTFGDGGKYKNEDSKLITFNAREMDFGFQYFGNFPKSLYTMFQILIGDSWAEMVVRPLVHGEDVFQSVAFALFFVTFIVLTGIVLINVAVAVLLEKVMEPDPDDPTPPPEKPMTPKKRVATLAAEVASVQDDMNMIREQLAAIMTAMLSEQTRDAFVFPKDKRPLTPIPDYKKPEMPELSPAATHRHAWAE